MKRSNILFFCLCFCLCFCLTIQKPGPPMNQFSFATAYVSSPGEYTLTQKSNGQILTISTTKGFSWVFPDIMPLATGIFVTPLCASSGITTDFGAGGHITGGFPGSYRRNGVLFPVIGNNYVGNPADQASFYYPTFPRNGRSEVSKDGFSPIVALGQTYVFSKSADSVQYALFEGDNTKMQASAVPTFNTVSFEVLNCGTASWCLQTVDQALSNPGVCEPGQTETCAAPTCATVTDQADCRGPYLIIDDGFCLSKCPAGKTTNSVSGTFATCQMCTGNCQECTDGVPTKCTSCIKGYYLSENECSDSCPAGTVADDKTMTCLPCEGGCQECSGTTTSCTKCKANFFLDNINECVEICPDGKYGNAKSGECESCKSPCSKCHDSEDICSSCVANYFLDDGSCTLTCSSGKYGEKKTGKCENCDDSCAQCSESATQCTICPIDNFLYKHTCVKECPASYTADLDSGKCVTTAAATTTTAAAQSSSKMAGWKVALAVGLPCTAVVSGIAILIFTKLTAKAAATDSNYSANHTTPMTPRAIEIVT